MNKLRKFTRLSFADQRLLMWAAATVLVVRAALYVLPFALIRNRITNNLNRRANKAAEDVAAADAHRVAKAVARASSIVPRATCLTQSLSLQWLLTQQGILSTLRIGVGRDQQGAFRAHAWVERNGIVLIGDGVDLRQFVQLGAVPPAKGGATESDLSCLSI